MITIQLNGSKNGHSLCHKGCNSVSTATLPDVCKTPTAGGPVPIPYPNVSFSKDLINGTKTITADGGNMIAVKGSEFSRSIGDEPGTVGGVKSNTNMKESKWITYSFDVKMEGRNACRLSDKKTQNHANTVDAMGTVHAPVIANFEKALCQIINQCEKEVNDRLFGPGGKPDKTWCKSPGAEPNTTKAMEIGNEKAKCAERKVNERKNKSTTDFSKTVQAEKYVRVPGGGWCKPDVVVGSPPSCDAVYDFKTSCPLTPSSKPSWPTYGTGRGQRTPPNPQYAGKTQFDIYKDSCGVEPKLIHPNSEICK